MAWPQFLHRTEHSSVRENVLCVIKCLKIDTFPLINSCGGGSELFFFFFLLLCVKSIHDVYEGRS